MVVFPTLEGLSGFSPAEANVLNATSKATYDIKYGESDAMLRAFVLCILNFYCIQSLTAQ